MKLRAKTISLVTSAADVRSRIAAFNQELASGRYWATNPARGEKNWKRVLPSYVHWVHDPISGDFAPSKFVGYSNVSMREYLSICSRRNRQVAARPLDGRETDPQLRRIAKQSKEFADHDFIPPARNRRSLLAKFARWADGLFPPDLRVSVDHCTNRKTFGIMRLAGGSAGVTGQAAGAGGGVRLSKAERDAIERRAIEVATIHLRRFCRTVRSVEQENRGYDLECKRKDGRPLHVEVKGVSSKGETIRISANEVEFARRSAARGSADELMLIVVSGIRLTSATGTKSMSATGGTLTEYFPWNIEQDGTLKPLTYKYTPHRP